MAPSFRSLCAAVLLLVITASCSENDSASPRPARETTTSSSPPGPLVVVGASDAVGIGADDPATEAWPQVLVRDAFPPGTELRNLGVAGATVATALQRMLPAALEQRGATVAVWLSVNDLIAGVSVTEYEEQLGQLVEALRAAGSNRVLVGNTPPLDRAPAYLACSRPGRNCLLGSPAVIPSPATVQQTVAAYNDAIARVVERRGAELVDLHAAGLATRTEGSETAQYSSDGFHPSTSGHQSIAAAFARVLRGG